MRDLLQDFSKALLNPDLPVPIGVVGPDSRPSPWRFAVYRNNVVVSLIDALAAGYPVVQRLVGEQFFRTMARIYAAAFPPSSPIMLQYGEGFADFIATFPPAASLPYLADVARLERAWSEAYHAADARPMTLDELARIPPDAFGGIHLELHPSLRLVRSQFPIVTIWQMNLEGGVLASVDLSIAENALVVRPMVDVEVRNLDGGSSTFVDFLVRGASPAEAAMQALALSPKFDVGGNLADLLGLGLVAGYRLGILAEIECAGGAVVNARR